jgi:hypothetical protein
MLAIDDHGHLMVIVAIMLFYGYEYWHFAWERNWRSDTVWGVRLWIPISPCRSASACCCCN